MGVDNSTTYHLMQAKYSSTNDYNSIKGYAHFNNLQKKFINLSCQDTFLASLYPRFAFEYLLKLLGLQMRVLSLIVSIGLVNIFLMILITKTGQYLSKYVMCKRALVLHY